MFMKKIIILLTVIVLVLMIFIYSAAFADDSINITIDGKDLVFSTDEAQAIEKNGRVLVPMRKIFEVMDILVDYDAETKTIKTKAKDHESLPTNMEMRIGDKNVRIRDCRTEILDVAPQLINNTTYVPLRIIAEASYCTIDWESQARTVSIKRKEMLDFDKYVDENIPQRIDVNNNSITINNILLVGFMDFGDVSTTRLSMLWDILFEENYEYLKNTSQEEREEINQIFSQYVKECGVYYDCNVSLACNIKKTIVTTPEQAGNIKYSTEESIPLIIIIYNRDTDSIEIEETSWVGLDIYDPEIGIEGLINQ